MNTTRLQQLLPQLRTQRPVTVVGAAVIDVIADAYALPWRGCDIELKQQGVNVGGCALNIAVTLKRLGIDACNALPLGQGVWADIIRNRMAKEGLHSRIDNAEGDNGWCLALVEESKERTFITIEGCEQHWSDALLAQIPVPDNALIYVSGYELVSPESAPLRNWLLAQSADKTLFADFGPRLPDIDPDFIEKLLAKKPLLTVNRDELAQLNPQGGKQSEIQTDDAQAFADSYGLPLIARFDKEGAVVCQPGQQPVRIPAYKVPVADTIAAGDSHCAGVLAGLACGQPLTDAVRTGNAVAAIVVSRPGSDGAPTRSELSEFLHHHL